MIGTHGLGKSHLLTSVVADVRRRGELKSYFPVVFPEESYEVATCGEFWLECLYHLSRQAPENARRYLAITYKGLSELYDDLTDEKIDEKLADACTRAIRDFARSNGKRLLLIVENLNMLFDQISRRKIRDTLCTTLEKETDIALLASATCTFEQIEDRQRAGHGLFRIVDLDPLEPQQCADLWKIVSGKSPTKEEIMPIHILTGGNPRLITKIASFGVGESFRDLMPSLITLVDDHTEYFKRHLEHLPPVERRIYIALARLWRPATAKEVAAVARTSTNKTSSLLRRLVRRGVVTSEGDSPRRRMYRLSERLYNIYYLLRRGGGSQDTVEALINFMIAWYAPRGLREVDKQVLRREQSNNLAASDVSRTVVEPFINFSHPPADIEALERCLRVIEQSSKSRDDFQDSAQSNSTEFVFSDSKALVLHWLRRDDEAIELCDKIIARTRAIQPIHDVDTDFNRYFEARALLCRSNSLTAQNRNEEAIRGYVDALAIFSDLARSMPESNNRHPIEIAHWTTHPIAQDEGGDQHPFLMVEEAFDEIRAEDWFSNSSFEFCLEFLTAFTRFGKALAHLKIAQTEEATAELDSIIRSTDREFGNRTAQIAADALAMKYILAPNAQDSDRHQDLLGLFEIVAQNTVTDLTLEAMVEAVLRNGSTSVLASIQTAGAERNLLPFATAMQIDVGQQPLVPKEVEEGCLRRS